MINIKGSFCPEKSYASLIKRKGTMLRNERESIAAAAFSVNLHLQCIGYMESYILDVFGNMQEMKGNNL